MNRHQHAIGAGAMFILFAAFLGAAFVEWARTEGDFGAKLTNHWSGIAAAVLMVASIGLGAILLVRRRVGRVALSIGALTAVAGASLAIVPGPFWLVAIPFMWLSYRGGNDD